jgi:DNA-binding transcriptional MerR regulator
MQRARTRADLGRGLTFEAGRRFTVLSMTTLRIAEVAERTGVPATTLRYYEDIGLLAPAGRAQNGYRAYDERDVERLRFITSAKQLDISLEDLRELVRAWDGEDCAGVQARMAQVVTARLAQTQERVVSLIELAAQLQSAVARLGEPATTGPCDPGCACSTAASTASTEPTCVELTRTPTGPLAEITNTGGAGQVPIACTLEAAQFRGRVSDWQAVLGRAGSRGPIPGGVALTFDHDIGVTTELARLAAAEHACCTFFDFTLAVTGDGVRFEVRAPLEAQDVVAAVFGPPGPAAW